MFYLTFGTRIAKIFTRYKFQDYLFGSVIATVVIDVGGRDRGFNK